MNSTDKEDVRRLRKRLGLNQTEFWGRVGVSRTLGSKYERLGSIPAPVTELLRLVFQEGVVVGTLESADFEAVEYLKRMDFALFVEISRLAREVSSRRGMTIRHSESANDAPDEPHEG